MKTTSILIFLILFFYPFKTLSTPCYGARMPEKAKAFFGVGTYNILERDLEEDKGFFKELTEFFITFLR
ncbi:MAG: hypothetical protein NC918_08415 [Candidatus Omnitrophica bacterium]|nr:hypothetical protein [Candidatus Omnitrophota bacterium]